MLSIIFVVAVVSFFHQANGQNQGVSLSARDSVVASLESFCYYIPENQQIDFSTTCTTQGLNQALSSSLDQFCSYFEEFQELFQCRAVIGRQGGPPYPLAPGYERTPSLQAPNTIILRPSQQPGGQPLFFNPSGQPIIFQKPTAGAGGNPTFTIQQQPAPQTSAGGRPIIININGTGDGSGSGSGNPKRPNIAGQTLDRQSEPAPPSSQGSQTEPQSPAAQGPAPAPAAPAPVPVVETEVDITTLVFSGEGDKLVTRCPPNTPLSWSYATWTIGNVRPYYESQGPKSSLEDCMKICESKEDCFFATYPLSTRKCYLLTTTHPEKCNYHNGPHYGALLDPCTGAQPCPSAYKRCAKPNCSLQSIIENFCKGGSKRQAVTACHP